MKKISCSAILAFVILTFVPVVKAQMRNTMTPSACATKGTYPAIPEKVLADCVIELVTENLNDAPLIVEEAQKLKTPEGQSELQKYLKKQIDIGDEAEKSYRFSSLLKDLVNALGEDDQTMINQQLMAVTVASPEKRRRCLPFLCVFRICC